MDSEWAAQNLQTIRVLMERTALYRRALAPIMVSVGCVGTGAALLGWKLEVLEPRVFIFYWLGVALGACGLALVLVRRQAIQAAEPMWSAPARRVVQAALPPLVAGLGGSLALLTLLPGLKHASAHLDQVAGLLWLPLGWVVLYGCALHAAGFFIPRGIRFFGWFFIIGGCLLFAGGVPNLDRSGFPHAIMGIFFGLLHQAYGVYLYLTEAPEAPL